MNIDLLNRLIELAKREHHHINDEAYATCPQSPEFDGKDTSFYSFEGGPCNCGAEDHNKLVDQIAGKLKEGLNDESAFSAIPKFDTDGWPKAR